MVNCGGIYQGTLNLRYRAFSQEKGGLTKYSSNVTMRNAMPDEFPDFAGIFTPSKAATFLGVSRMTLWRWTKLGRIRAILFNGHPVYALGELVKIKEGWDG